MIQRIVIDLGLPDGTANVDEVVDDFVKYVHDTLWVDEQENMPLSIPEEATFSVRRADGAERCPICGQADNCGDCTHEPSGLPEDDLE